MTEGEDLELVARVLPGNNSLTHFTDFRCSHAGLAALLAAAHKDAYREGWNDREEDLIVGIARITPYPAESNASIPSEASTSALATDDQSILLPTPPPSQGGGEALRTALIEAERVMREPRQDEFRDNGQLTATAVRKVTVALQDAIAALSQKGETK